MPMLSSKPYLLRALYEWILDSDCTPHVVVDALVRGTDVPPQFVKNGQIVLNISPTAVVDLLMDKAAVSFNARFAGVPTDVYVPMEAVLGIYARENGRGMMFEPEAGPGPDETPPTDEGGATTRKPPAGKPTLRVVK